MFGGNSNWRGPISMPVNVLVIRALLQYYLYYGDNFKIECPTGSGKLMNLFEVSHEIAKRLEGIFLRDKSGRRPVFGGTEKFQTDPRYEGRAYSSTSIFTVIMARVSGPATRQGGPAWWRN